MTTTTSTQLRQPKIPFGWYNKTAVRLCFNINIQINKQPIRLRDLLHCMHHICDSKAVWMGEKRTRADVVRCVCVFVCVLVKHGYKVFYTLFFVHSFPLFLYFIQKVLSGKNNNWAHTCYSIIARIVIAYYKYE